MSRRVVRVGALALACGMLGVSMVSGDTLVLKDGRELSGTIERIDGGYIVKSPAGSTRVDRADVSEWRRTTTPAPTSPPVSPTAPAAKPATLPTAAAAPLASGSVPSTKLTAAEKGKKTAEILVGQGLDALSAGDIKAARDCFVDVLQVDPRNRKSLEALGYCYLKMDDIPRASRSLEGALAVPEPVGRSLAMNLSFSLLRNRNPIRGAKILRDYLASQSGSVDEAAINAFAICLGQASEEARLNRVFLDLVKFYDEQNAKLEATRPGKKRWGVDWIVQSEWETKETARKATQKKIDAKWSSLSAARAEFNSAKSRYENAAAGARFRKTNDNLGALASDVKSKASKVDKLQEEYNELIAKLERPTLPNLFAAVPMDDVSTMLASAGTTSAGSGSAPSRGSGSASSSPGPAVATNTPPRATTPPTLVKPSVPPPMDPPPSVATGNPPPVTPSTPTPQPVDPPVAVRPTPKPAGGRSVFTYATGFAVSTDLMVTTADCVEGASRINVQPSSGEMLDAEIVKVDSSSGLALIRIKGMRMPYVGVGQSFAGGTITCAGFPVASLFDPESEVITGSAAATKEKWTVRLARHPRLAGAPLISNGTVVGVELASRESETSALPAANLQQLQAFLAATPLPAAPGSVDPKAIVGVVSAVRNR